METLAANNALAKSPTPGSGNPEQRKEDQVKRKEPGNGSVFMTDSLSLYKGLVSVRSSLHRMTNNAEQQRILPPVTRPRATRREVRVAGEEESQDADRSNQHAQGERDVMNNLAARDVLQRFAALFV